MSFTLRRLVCAAVFVAAVTGGIAPASQAASPDFYGIKMNSENHARDLSPDELSLFPVRRGFDKNIYAYAHLERAFNNTRSITFNIFNNTDNDLLVEKSFREYYVVLRNGERYRLNEPGMSWNKDRIEARSSAALRADFGDLNVTKEQIEMVVCSFDMGKVKIVLLPIAQEPPPPAQPAEPAKQPSTVPVYAKDQVEGRIRGENEIRRAGEPGKGGRFPVMDLPIFSWLKNASTPPETEIKPVPAAGASSREARAVESKSAAPQPKTNVVPKTQATPAAASPALPPPAAAQPATVAPLAEGSAKPPARKGFFGSLFSIFSPGEGRTRASTAQPKKSAPASAAKAPAGDKEFFWKPRDLEPIPPIEEFEKKKSTDKKKKPAPERKAERETPAPSKAPEAAPSAKPFFMRRVLEDDVKIPKDEPVTAVSTTGAKSKAPVLKPEKKLRRVSPRTEAKVSQVNRQMGFIIVNAGSADGLRENMVLNIYRRGRVIGKAMVRKLNEDAAAALLMKEWTREEIAVGDPVSFY